MKFLPVLKWMIAILMLAALTAGSGTFYLASQKERLVQNEILKHFANIAPELQLLIERTEVDGTQQVTLHGLEVRDRQSGQPLFRGRKLTVDLDSSRLLEDQKPVINRIHLSSADVLMIREADGRWNWQKYTFQPPAKSSAALPDIVLDDVSVRLTLQHHADVPAAHLNLQNSRLQAVPSSGQSYDFDGSLALPGVGELKLAGEWDLNSKSWSLGGKLRNVQADDQLMELLKSTAPELNGRLDQLDAAIANAVPTRTAAVTDAHVAGGAALQLGNDGSIAPRFQGTIDVDFAVSGQAESAVPNFKLLVNVRDGRIATPVVPFAFTNVQAKFFRDNESVVFQLDNATGNDASIRGGFEMATGPDADAPQGWFDIKRFPFSARLRPLLPERTLRLFDAFRPDLLVSVSGKVRQSVQGKWQPHDLVAEIHDGTAVYHKFQYPAEGLKGTIRQRPFGVKAEGVSLLE